MMGTILAWTAPLAGTAALVGLWRSTNLASRQMWRSLAIVTALGATTLMALIALPDGAEVGSFLAAAGTSAAMLYGAGLWLAMTALLVDEYRRAPRAPWASSRRVSSTLWTDVTRELTAHDSLDTMLMNIAGAFRRDVDGACAHVYKISMARRAAYRTGTVFSERPYLGDHGSEHGGLLAELAWWGAQEYQSAIVDGAGGTPILTLPIRDDNTTYAIIMIENPVHAETADWPPMAAMVGRSISDWCQLAQYRDSGIVAQRITALMPQLLREDRIEAALNVIDRVLKGVVDYDYVSISSLGASRAHEDRATMLAGSQRVIESRHRWPVAGVTLHRVLSTGRAVITPDLDMSGDEDETDNVPWERRLGMRSRLIAPISDGERVIGSITLGHRQFARYSETEVELVGIMSAFLTPWMRQIDSTRKANRTDRALTFLRKLETSIFASMDEKSIVQDASTVVEATGLRVYRLDDDAQSLVEVAASGRLPNGDGPRQIPLTQLPWHRWALDSKRTLSVDQGDPESVMSGEEAAIAMDKRMKTGCLVPIIANGKPLGVIDVVEQRHPDRNTLDGGSKLILETLASMLAQKWVESEASETTTTNSQQMCERLKGWSRQVVNPLTSIIGSVELIRYKSGSLDSDAIKYLSTIERSATRIHESLMTIIAEASSGNGDGGLIAPRGRWTFARASEQSQIGPTEFARPASLAEAAMRGAATIAADSAASVPVGIHTNMMS